MLFMSLLVDWIQPRRNQWASGYVNRSFSNLKAKWKSKNIYEMWETCKRYNISIMWIPEREQREIKAEDIFKEMIAENFPKLMSDTKSQIQTSQRKPCKILKNSTPKHVIFKLQEMKENEQTLQEAVGEGRKSYL